MASQLNGKKYLSVMTDDFGLSPSINRGVRDSFVKGILTDASLMANAPAFDEAVGMARAGGIAIAAHVNLVRGSMLTGANFPGSVPALWKDSLSHGCLSRIEKEARAQIEKILKNDIKIYQLNSEKHCHFFPPIFKLWIRLAGEYSIPNVRFIREFNMRPSAQGAKANLLSLFSLINRRYLEDSGVRCTDHFAGILATGCLDRGRLVSIIENAGAGWTELITHVGYDGDIDPSMGKYFLKGRRREVELGALIDPQIVDILAANGVILRNFRGQHGK